MALMIAPLLVAFVLTAAATPLLSATHALSSVNLSLALLAAALNVAGTTVPFALLRSEQRVRQFVIIVITSALTTTLGTVTLVIILHLGVTAWLAAIVASNALTLLMAL